MSFQSLSFLLFLAVGVPICLWAGRKNQTAGKRCLLLASLLFCLTNGLGGILILGAGTAVTAWVRRHLAGDGSNRHRWLIFGCVYHLVILAEFKYLPVGWSPVGISFFTFQQLWLLKEAYTRQYVPEKGDSLLLHAVFFPTITSGPILRPGSFFPQLRGETFLRPADSDIAAGLCAIVLGTAKKVLLADQLGIIVSNGWAAAANLSVPAAWVAMAAYTLQLYLDFSGYCDIAAGCARLLGIRLPVNFDSPYRSLSVGEFWKRWHITLTTFLRECVYFPLGGSRKGAVRTYLNIMLVFLVSGVWHGNGWTFVVWGALHGAAQVLERIWGPARGRLPKAFRWGLTMFFVNFAWVFFRAPDMASAVDLLCAAVTRGGAVGVSALAVGVFESEVTAVTTILPALTGTVNVLLPIALLTTGAVVSLWPRNTTQKMEELRPTVLSAVAFAVLVVWAILSFSGVTTFIYSNF